MRVLPILFNTEMVKAILDGRKTVTRRICIDANDCTVPDMSFFDAERRTYAVHNFADKEHIDSLSIAERKCPICPGDILYVRETWFKDAYRYMYRADYNENEKFYQDGNEVQIKWHPSLHMPKEAARIWLKVTDVRVERLQEIDIDGIRKEGLPSMAVHAGDSEIALKEFEILWNSTIKKSYLDCYGWDASPWVWVIEFERSEKPDE